MKKDEEGRSPRSRFRLHRSPPTGPPVVPEKKKREDPTIVSTYQARQGDLQSLLDEVAKESRLRKKNLNSERGLDLERFVSSTQVCDLDYGF